MMGVGVPPSHRSDGTVYVGSNVKFLCLNQDGSVMGLESGVPWFSPAIGSDGTVYVGWLGGFMPQWQTGVKLWDLNRQLGGFPAIGWMARFTSVLWITLYAINGKTGVKLWEFETGYKVVPPPTIRWHGLRRFLGRKLYAINGQTGVKLWEFEMGGDVKYSSPTIGSDGTVCRVLTKSSMPQWQTGVKYGI